MAEFLHHYLAFHLRLNGKKAEVKKDRLPTLDRLRKDYIHYLLEITQNNVSEAAKILSVSRSTLYNVREKQV